jgi:hypothetical protein
MIASLSVIEYHAVQSSINYVARIAMGFFTFKLFVFFFPTDNTLLVNRFMSRKDSFVLARVLMGAKAFFSTEMRSLEFQN